MTSRNQQRDATRELIIDAALTSFSESGFDGASTRQIADRADVSQGLLTYHFKSKDALWRAAADKLFAMLEHSMMQGLAPLMMKANSPKNQKDKNILARESIRQIVYFNAAHPELMRFMIEAGKDQSERVQWLVATHIRPLYERFTKSNSRIPAKLLPHAFYIVAGASGAIFSVPEECERVTGINPRTKSAIETHAEFVAQLMVPD